MTNPFKSKAREAEINPELKESNTVDEVFDNPNNDSDNKSASQEENQEVINNNDQELAANTNESSTNDQESADSVIDEDNSELEKIKTDFEKLNSQYIRLAADFDNYRKRQEQERENLIKYGAADTLKKLLEILDNFERGEKALESVEDCQVVKDNFNKIHKQVVDVLGKLGLETIETEGKEFDPNFHEAVMQTPTSEHPEHTVINELQKGYKLGGKVLRPALVNVAVAE